jgi:hypothetical protein
MAIPQKKTKIGRIQQRILELLKQNGPQSRLELLCAVYQYRHAAGNILYWSVLERQYLQQKKFDDATKLLECVLEYAKERGFLEPPVPKPEPTFDDLEPQFPPEKIVVQHATRRVTNGVQLAQYNAAKSAKAAGSLVDLFKQQEQRSREIAQILNVVKPAVGIASTVEYLLSKSDLTYTPQGLDVSQQRPNPQYEEVPEVRDTHPWHVANAALQPYLEKWSWREWQDHPEERMKEKEKDALKTQLQKLVNKAHASITRALKTLEKSGGIEMTLNGWIIREQDAKTLPEDLVEQAKNV